MLWSSTAVSSAVETLSATLRRSRQEAKRTWPWIASFGPSRTEMTHILAGGLVWSLQVTGKVAGALVPGANGGPVIVPSCGSSSPRPVSQLTATSVATPRPTLVMVIGNDSVGSWMVVGAGRRMLTLSLGRSMTCTAGLIAVLLRSLVSRHRLLGSTVTVAGGC